MIWRCGLISVQLHSFIIFALYGNIWLNSRICGYTIVNGPVPIFVPTHRKIPPYCFPSSHFAVGYYKTSKHGATVAAMLATDGLCGQRWMRNEVILHRWPAARSILFNRTHEKRFALMTLRMLLNWILQRDNVIWNTGTIRTDEITCTVIYTYNTILFNTNKKLLFL